MLSEELITSDYGSGVCDCCRMETDQLHPSNSHWVCRGCAENPRAVRRVRVLGRALELACKRIIGDADIAVQSFLREAEAELEVEKGGKV